MRNEKFDMIKERKEHPKLEDDELVFIPGSQAGRRPGQLLAKFSPNGIPLKDSMK
jgi:hypothetical protein